MERIRQQSCHNSATDIDRLGPLGNIAYMGAQRRAVVVEDVPDVLELLRAQLTFSGYDVATAVDGLEALDAIRATDPHIVIADVVMPRMGGAELVRHLRTDGFHQSTPVILFTGLARDAHEVKQVLALPLVAFVQKGQPLRSLLDTMNTLLAASGVPMKDPTEAPLG